MRLFAPFRERGLADVSQPSTMMDPVTSIPLVLA